MNKCTTQPTAATTKKKKRKKTNETTKNEIEKNWTGYNVHHQNRRITSAVMVAQYCHRAHLKAKNECSRNSIWSKDRNSAVRSV